MLGNRGERDLEWGGEFGNRGFALREAREDGAAGGIGERAERGIQGGGARRGGIVNHMV